jgi:hypothetical protein
MWILFRTGPSWTAEQFDNHVKTRLFRQERVVDIAAPLPLSAIVDQSVLTQPVGGIEVMRAQLNQMIELAELPTVSLQVFRHSKSRILAWMVRSRFLASRKKKILICFVWTT